MAERFNQPVPQPQVQEQRSRFDLDIADDQYIDGRQLKQIVSGLVNQPPPVDYVARQQALALTVDAVKRQWPDEFKKWGSEIEQEFRKLPVEHWNVDTLNQLVKLVRSNHIDELAAEKAQRLLSESHPTIRSGTGGSGSVTQTQPSIFETADSDLLATLRSVGIHNEGDLKRACDTMGGISPEQYVAEFRKFGKGSVIYG